MGVSLVGHDHVMTIWSLPFRVGRYYQKNFNQGP